MTTAATHTYVRSHTATYLTDVILGAIGDMLADLKIPVDRLYSNWDVTEKAIKAWVEEGALDQVVVECHRPSGVVDPIIEFPVSYNADGAARGTFTASRARLARFRDKIDSVPSGTTFALIITFNGPHSSQPGWTAAARADTGRLHSINFGTISTAPHGTADMRYLHG